MAIAVPGSDLPAAVMIAGASSRLPFDDLYRGFYDLVAGAMHSGSISVSSVLGQGTQFAVSIPVGRGRLPSELVDDDGVPSMPIGANPFVEEALRWLPDEAALPPGRPSQENPTSTNEQPRIVLADDNADMRAYVAQLLRQDGYAVEVVADGEAALSRVRMGPLPDLVLTDVMMPGLDGFGLLQALRADPATGGLLVILLSARAGEEARVEGLAAGADDYLVKPFSARELRARVGAAISLARAASQRRDA